MRRYSGFALYGSLGEMLLEQEEVASEDPNIKMVERPVSCVRGTNKLFIPLASCVITCVKKAEGCAIQFLVILGLSASGLEAGGGIFVFQGSWCHTLVGGKITSSYLV